MVCLSRSWLLLFPTLWIICIKNGFMRTFVPNLQEADQRQIDILKYTWDYNGAHTKDEVFDNGTGQSHWRFLSSLSWSSRADALNPERTPSKFKTERRSLSNIFHRSHDSSNHKKPTKSTKPTGKTKASSSKKSSSPSKKAKTLSDTKPSKKKGKDKSSDKDSTSGKGKKESKKSKSTRKSPVSPPSPSDGPPVRAPVFIWRPIDREPSSPRPPAPVRAPVRVPTLTSAPTPTITTEPGSPPPVIENGSSSPSPTTGTQLPTINSSLGSSDFPTSQMIAQPSPRPSSSNQPSALSSLESSMGSSDEASDVPTFFSSDPPSLLQSFSPTRVGNPERLDEKNGQKKFAFRLFNSRKFG